jgi:hypothetical protein
MTKVDVLQFGFEPAVYIFVDAKIKCTEFIFA